MPRIFISYRRADSEIIAGRIYDRLEAEYGEENIFKDVDDIPIGEDFRSFINREIANSDVMLVVIGRDWLEIKDSAGNRRLDNPIDAVRIEIETGLARGTALLTIPVLINNASMPLEAILPSSIRQLHYKNAANVRNDPDFRRDMSRLISALDEYFEAAKPSIEPVVEANVTSNLRIPWTRTRMMLGIGIGVLAFIMIASFINNVFQPQPPATFDPLGTANVRLTQTANAQIAALATDTPDVEASVAALMTNFVTETSSAMNAFDTATADAYTDTPTASPTPSNTPTEDYTATSNAQGTLDAQATANVPTNTPQPTATVTLTSTPTTAPTFTPTPSLTPTPNIVETQTAESIQRVKAQGDAQATQTAQAIQDAEVTSAPCIILTDNDHISVRVGPGLNRGIRGSLPINQNILVIGKAVADDGSLWWKIKPFENDPKEENRYWVAQTDVNASGPCDQIDVVEASPLIINSSSSAEAKATKIGGEYSPCNNGPTSSLAIGATGITVYYPGHMYSSLSPLTEIGDAPRETKFTVLEGPFCYMPTGRTVYIMWKVRFEDGTVTHIAEASRFFVTDYPPSDYYYALPAP